jgi:hypothetical protein
MSLKMKRVKMSNPALSAMIRMKAMKRFRS